VTSQSLMPTITYSNAPSAEPTIISSNMPSESIMLSQIPTRDSSEKPSQSFSSVDSSSAPSASLPIASDAPTLVLTEPSSDEPSQNPIMASSETPTQTSTIDSSEVPTQISPIGASEMPSISPTMAESSEEPTIAISAMMSDEPTIVFTRDISEVATLVTTELLSDAPTQNTSEIPTLATIDASEAPSASPTVQESATPTITTTELLSNEPSQVSTRDISGEPTETIESSEEPSVTPKEAKPSQPKAATSSVSSNEPSWSSIPSLEPTKGSSEEPTVVDSKGPSEGPSSQPSLTASEFPSQFPTAFESEIPTASAFPSHYPSGHPSITISGTPSASFEPSLVPTMIYSEKPTDKPSLRPSEPRTISGDLDFVPIYINTGGDEFTDSNGTLWAADIQFNTGTKYTAKGRPVTGTADDALYLTERWDPPSGPELMYEIPISREGEYQVTLFFSETYFDSVGKRVFDVSMEGTVVIENLDIFDEAGGAFIALSKTEMVSITDGSLTIEFIHGAANNPKISGIQVLPAAQDTNSNAPAMALSSEPSMGPSASAYPSTEPSSNPSNAGSESPSSSKAPSLLPSTAPSDTPSLEPSTNPSAAPTPSWIDKDENENYIARHECSFVQAGTKFYMFGGREFARRLDTYDFANNAWSTSAVAPKEFNHFQATEYEGLIWVIAAFKHNGFPTEAPAESIWVYDPANDVWMEGPEIPVNRRRGGGGLVVYQGRFYISGGNKIGHKSGYVAWLDEYDPHTNSWTILADAPHQRDHFHAAVVSDKMYAVGGRRTAHPNALFSDTVPEVDVYDFGTGEWLSSNVPDDLPIPRAGAATAVFDGRIMIMGGESGVQATAHDEVHALDTETGTWSTLPSMNHPRHGTQAIVSGQGVYVAGGSPQRGGGNQKNMEVYNADDPAGVPSEAGVISATLTMVDIDFGSPKSVTLQHVNGTQGVFVQSISVSGQSASDFSLSGIDVPPLLIGKGSSLDIFVEYTGLTDGEDAQLDVVFSGNQVISVTLLGWSDSQTPSSLPSLAPSMMIVPAFVPIYINAGGDEFTDSNGIVWAADTYHNDGNNKWVASGLIGGTEDDELYLSERWDPDGGDELIYEIPIPQGGDYEVTLFFSENYVGNAGKRVFDVSMEGTVVFENVDIFAEAGGAFRAMSKTKTVSVTDGSLTIELIHGVENPKISAIGVHAVSQESGSTISGMPSIKPSSAPSMAPSTSKSPSLVPSNHPSVDASEVPSLSQAPTNLRSVSPSQKPSTLPSYVPSMLVPGFDPIYINAGGGEFTDSNGTLWAADINFNTGNKYTAKGRPVTGTADDAMYLSERWDPPSGPELMYEIPISREGEYQVTLFFSETYFDSVGERVFDVSMEGTVVIEDFDIVGEAGGAFIAISKIEIVSVTDGSLTIEFIHHGEANNPKISGIAVHAVSLESGSTISSMPSVKPSSAPSLAPSMSQSPSLVPSNEPSVDASEVPSLSQAPTSLRSVSPSQKPSTLPTMLVPGFDPIYINAGGGEFTDSKGTLWAADINFNTGTKYTAKGRPVTGTADDAMYLSERWDPPSVPELMYEIPISREGEYQVTLYFSENYFDSVGKRVFDVSMEGTVVIENLDIFGEAGGAFIATSKTETVSVTDGSLTIKFIHGAANNPKISGIEVHAIASSSLRNAYGGGETSTSAPSGVPSRFPSGMPSLRPNGDSTPFPSTMPSFRPSNPPAPPTSVFLDTGILGEDTSIVNGITWRYGVKPSVAISNIDIPEYTPEFFRTHRSGKNFTYTIGGLVSGATYSVKLGFAEIWAPNCNIGKRVMSLSLNGNVVNPDLDVYKEVGCNAAYIETHSVQALYSGKIVIGLDASVENSMLSLIKIEN